ncbi:putative Rab-GTPase-TBC domain-containing protein [Helianthus debilis subsp. tardiflorus]
MNLLRKDPGLATDSFYEVRAECTYVPKTKFKIKSGKTLSVRKWRSAFSPEGYLDIGQTLGRIYRGGVNPTIRGEVWEFLLGCFDPKSTYEERKEIRLARREEYVRLKELCTYMFPLVGSGKFITAPVITEDGTPTQDPIVLLEANHEKLPTAQATGLDVVRTDRMLVFYEKPENLGKLWDVLSVYAWFDKEVGYGQGMSDLCSPMIMLLEDEADAFWCFERLMRRLRGNFKCIGSTVGVESQLWNLANVIHVVDPKLHKHLDYIGGGDYLFAFRMLMVLFRREVSFGDSLYLWEMMWALEYDPDLYTLYEEPDSERPEDAKGKRKSSRQCGKYEREYLRSGAKNGETLPISVFLVASVLKEKSVKLLTQAKGLDDVVKILNDTSDNLDARKSCSGAMKLHKKYLKKVHDR